MGNQADNNGAISGHTPVSNLGVETNGGGGGKTLSNPPAEGPNADTRPPRTDGTEALEGHRLIESVRAELFVAPVDKALADIGEASFGPPPPIEETVHGPDDRVRITATSIYPWRVHASLLITAADNSQWLGTGWFVGPHTLITAGHVVYIKNSGVPGRDGWVKRIQVMPGRNGSSLPYGSATSSSFRSVLGWTRDGSENYDYGAIILSSNLGSSTGWLGYGVFPDAALTSSVGNISGYPADKPAGTQWYDSRRIASVNSLKVYYDIDTFGGQSGSAVYRIVDGARFAVAIHAYGGPVTNSGTRITTPVYNNITAWRA